MLLELAVGDAYGAGFEYVDRAAVAAGNNLSRYVAHPRRSSGGGRYTDDTQMSLAIAEAIVAGLPWTPEALAAKFVEVFKRDPREGYTTWFHAFLTCVGSGAQLLAELSPSSVKSGAAMRAGPIGVFETIPQVLDMARTQAKVTHDTSVGIDSACAAALMVHYFLYRRGTKDDLGTFLQDHVPGRWANPWQGPVGEEGWMSVRAAVTAIRQSDSLRELLHRCVDFTGDVDTVAAIALAAGSGSVELTQDLPDHLIEQLEAGRFGRHYIAALDRQLLALKAPTATS